MCWWLYLSCFLIGNNNHLSVFLLLENRGSLPACDKKKIKITGLLWFITNTVHSLLWGSHTHSWHSVEIFSSLVLPRKILTRAPKFPVLGLFSPWNKKRNENLHKLQQHHLLTVWNVNKKKKYVEIFILEVNIQWCNCTKESINKIHPSTKIFML